MPLKATEEDKEEIQEVTVNPEISIIAAAVMTVTLHFHISILNIFA